MSSPKGVKKRDLGHEWARLVDPKDPGSVGAVKCQKCGAGGLILGDTILMKMRKCGDPDPGYMIEKCSVVVVDPQSLPTVLKTE